MPLFSKRGKLKTDVHLLNLFIGVDPDLKFPSSTPGKVPLAERGELGRLDHLLKKFHRFEKQVFQNGLLLKGRHSEIRMAGSNGDE